MREPALDFIEAMEPVLKRFAPHFRAEARKVGGSLMRVYRDTRFARDKTPYKTKEPLNKSDMSRVVAKTV